MDCGSTKWQQQFTFDPFGNVKKSGTSSFLPTYSTANTNRFSWIPGVTVSYDVNGNLLTDNLNTYTWSPFSFGNAASINSTNLIYDGFGRMVEQQNGSSYAQILYSPMGKTAIMNGQTLAKAFINLPGGGTAIYNSTGLAYYRHTDWLGSSRLTSTASRTVFSDSAYAPFGEQYTATGTADASFTGQNSDTVASLNDFTFREDSPSQGRWISPDPAGMAAVDPTNPQSWNRYAYVMNSPLNNIDLLGLCHISGDTTVSFDENGIETIHTSSTACASPPPGCMNLVNEQGEFIGMVCGFGIGQTTSQDPGESWSWTFTKSFFTFAGCPGNVPTCAGQALRAMGNTLNPFTPGVSTATEAAAPVAQAVAINQGIAQTQVGIDAYIAARGLTVPLRSSIVRAMAAEGAEGAVAAGARANLAVQTLAVDYAAVKAGYLTSKEALSGECAAAFPIF